MNDLRMLDGSIKCSYNGIALEWNETWGSNQHMACKMTGMGKRKFSSVLGRRTVLRSIPTVFDSGGKADWWSGVQGWLPFEEHHEIFNVHKVLPWSQEKKKNNSEKGARKLSSFFEVIPFKVCGFLPMLWADDEPSTSIREIPRRKNFMDLRISIGGLSLLI